MNHSHFPTPETQNTSETQPTLKAPETTAPSADLPTTSPDRTCGFYLREIERLGRMGDVKEFLLDTADRDFHEFSDPIDLDAFGAAYAEFIDPSLTEADKTTFKNYTGFNYKLINQVSRGIWDYDTLGRKTPELAAEAEQSIEALSAAIARVPSPGVDLVAHRGTNLDSFRSYGINSLADLANLEGQFYLETGFMSTSLSPDHSFADRDFDDPLRRACDISIVCRVPKEARETVALLTSDTSYNPEQSELLIDKDSLFYISSAEVSDDQKKATLEMTLIPRDLYDRLPEN